MKKLITLMVAVIVTATTFAQLTGADKKAEKLLDKNMASLTEFSEMITNDFTRQSVVGNVVSGKTFKMGTIVTLVAYGDEGINKTANELEVELNKGLGNSIWVFTPFVEYSTDSKVTVTGNGETNVGTYSQSTDIFLKIDDLIKGFPIEAMVHQNKKDKNNYIIVFPAPGGTISVAAEFNITTDKAASKKTVIKDEAAKATNDAETNSSTKAKTTMGAAAKNVKVPDVKNIKVADVKVPDVKVPDVKNAATTEVKNKAKNAVKGKLGKLF